jgi:hypothetical protein
MPRHWGLGDKKLNSVVRTAIGKELKTRYEVPQTVPHRLLTMLMQLGGRKRKNETSRKKGSVSVTSGKPHLVEEPATQ